MIEVTLFSRDDCHLCEQAKHDLEALQEIAPHHLTVVDVDGNPGLRRKYGFEVPVVTIGPYTLKAPISRQDLQMTLGAAMDRERHIEMVENSPALEEARRQRGWSKSDSLSLWLSRHYLAALNIFVVVYLGLPFLAPVLMKIGATGPASLIYRGYDLVCHQLAYRSFFLFGNQWFYPRASAGLYEYLSLSQATGIGESNSAVDINAARKYVGNEEVGYKIALCERDVAIYGGILLFGLVFAIFQKRIPPLPIFLWVLIGIAPIALDGFSQLLSQPPLSLFVFRESTPLLRVLTGGLFGFATAWFSYPVAEQSMADSRQYLESKHNKILG